MSVIPMTSPHRQIWDWRSEAIHRMREIRFLVCESERECGVCSHRDATLMSSKPPDEGHDGLARECLHCKTGRLCSIGWYHCSIPAPTSLSLLTTTTVTVISIPRSACTLESPFELRA